MFAVQCSNDSVVMLDGGLTAELERQGIRSDGLLWTAELLHRAPEALVDAHRAYLDAGAEVVISASYQASRAGFHQVGIDAQTADKLIASSVTLARQAVEDYLQSHSGSAARHVAASIGPYGAVLNDGSEYRGDYGVTDRVLHDFHASRLKVLDEAGADILACETIPSALEAAVLGELLHDAETPAWMSFSCRDENTICDGTDIQEICAALAAHPKIFALGINCTPPQFVTALIRKIRSAAPDKLIVVYPNSGESYVAGENTWTGEQVLDDLVAYAKEWRAAGASLIGGCCRVGPDQISALAAAFRAEKKS